MIGTIKALNSTDGRGLRKILPDKETWSGRFLADTRLLDTRYVPGRTTSAGEALRPRHLTLGAGLLALGYLGWKALTVRR